MLYHQDPAMKAAETLALTGILATLAGWLPPIAALMSAVWYGWLIVDKMIKRWRQYRADKKAAG